MGLIFFFGNVFDEIQTFVNLRSIDHDQILLQADFKFGINIDLQLFIVILVSHHYWRVEMIPFVIIHGICLVDFLWKLVTLVENQ